MTVTMKSRYFGTCRRISWRKFTEYSQEDIASILKGEEVVYIIFDNAA